MIALAILTSVVLAPTATNATEARQPRGVAETRIRVDPRLFGVHDAHLSSLSRPGTGSIRLWDTYTTWALLQPQPGPPDFSRLDHIVTLAHQNGTEVTLVVAMTPGFAAPDPSNPAYQTEMPDLAAYKSFVGTVMARYRDFFGTGVRGIANYQVWNEANIDTFWTGTPAQMARLTRAMWHVRNRVDPGARVVAPALEARMPYQRAWLERFFAQRVGGRPVWKFFDVVSLNLYPRARYGGRPGMPEDVMRLLARCRALLARDGVPKALPVWNTEVNYGLRSGTTAGPAVPIPDDLQVAYLMRTYLLSAAAGVGRVFWYAYDMGNLPEDRGGAPLGNTLMTSPLDRTTLTPAGRAFQMVQTWLHGTLVGRDGKQPCARDTRGTYACLVRYAGGRVGRIYWNPYTTARVTLPPSARSRVDATGSVTAIDGRRHLKVGYLPVLVRSAA